MKILHLLPIAFLAGIACNHDLADQVDQGGEIIEPVSAVLDDDTYFKGDFDSVNISNKKITGGGWEFMNNNEYTNAFFFHDIPDPTLGFQEIKRDPANSNNLVLYQQVVDDPVGSSGQRAQVVWDLKKEMDVYHISYKIMLHPDIYKLTQYPSKIIWFVIMEMWEQHNPNLDGDMAGQARWGMSIRKDEGTGKDLFWAIHADYMQPRDKLMTSIWPIRENRVVPVKVGQWAVLDFYMKRGQGKDGHLLVTLQYDGEPQQTLFDVHDYTEYPGNPLPIYSWNVWKLYTADPIMDFMRNNDSKIAAYYDDFRWYKD